MLRAYRPVVALLLYTVLTLALFHDAWSAPATRWIGICCDPEQSMWYLRWTPYAVAHLHTPFFTTHLNYPDGVNLMWNTSMTLPALLLAPITLTLGPVVAYNVLLTGGVALSAWCAFLALRRFCRNAGAAWLGGLVYGFSPYMLPQALDHVNLSIAVTPPLLLILVDSLLRTRRRPALIGAAVGAVLVAQLLTDENILLSELIVLVVMAIVLAVTHARAVGRAARHIAIASGTAAYTFILLAAWPLHTQLFGSERLVGNVFAPDVFVTDLLNFIVPTDRQLIAPHLAVATSARFTGLGLEANGYLGIPLILLLTAATVLLWRVRPVRIAALTGVIVAVLSLGPHLHLGGHVTGIPLPWALLARLPIFGDLLPSRLMLLVFLAVALIVAVAADRLAAAWRRARSWAGLVVIAAALVPLLPAQPFPFTPTTIPAFFARWDRSGVRCGAVVLIAPFIRDGGEADPMLWQAVAGDGFRMPQGFYFIPGPSGTPMYGAIGTTLTDAMENIQETGVRVRFVGPARRDAMQYLASRRIDTIVVGPMTNHDAMVDFFTALLGRPPQDTGGAQVWRDVGGTPLAQ